jgi:biopolymer transport protein TolR
MAGMVPTAQVGKRRHRRRPVMSEINVTPMVDVMLVLLIIFMVAAPLLTVGVPVDLPQTQAKSLDVDREPLVVTVRAHGEIFVRKPEIEAFLQNSEIKVDELVPKLEAITQARGGLDEKIYVRGDRNADYGAMMRIMTRLQTAGFRRLALITELEQETGPAR